ncbi:MAG: aspartyl protease family protein [Sphingomonas sp.]|nr:aspartyl protease family protein [Sphingomonas sp.]
MSSPRRALIVAFGMMLAVAAHALEAAAQAPRIRKPTPAPPGPSNVPPIPPAVFDPGLAIGGEDVKARKVETRLTVQVRVNGRGPYDFIVDSGADTSVVGLRIARDLQLPLGTPAILNAMTSRTIIDRVKVAQLNLGPTTIRDLQLPALRERDLGGDGMIGIDALVRQRLMMDFEKRLIKVEDASIPDKRQRGDIVIIARRKRGQLILTQVTAAGLPLDAVIDTGTEITIGNLALRDKLIRRNRDKFKTIAVTDVAGRTMDVQVAWIGKLQLGPVTLRDVPMAFADLPPFGLFGLADGPALLLGTDILENFRRVSLDFKARKVRFQLKKCSTSVMMSISTQAPTRISSEPSPEVCSH